MSNSVTSEPGTEHTTDAHRTGVAAAANADGRDDMLPSATGLIDTEISLMDIIRTISRGWYIILAFIVICTCIALIKAYTMEPLYLSDTLLAPISTEQNPISRDGALGTIAAFPE
jgi:hypothetical protein